MDKPLNVRVAEALGWTDFKQMATQNVGMPNLMGGFSSPKAEKIWCGVAPIDHDPKECVNLYDGEACDHVPSHPDYEPWHEPVPPYGEDSPEGWACTGPHIQELGITTTCCGGAWSAFVGYDPYRARGDVASHDGSCAVEVAANLILALAAAGKLTK